MRYNAEVIRKFSTRGLARVRLPPPSVPQPRSGVSAVSAGGGRMAGGTGGAGLGDHRFESVVPRVIAPGKKSAEENDSQE